MTSAEMTARHQAMPREKTTATAAAADPVAYSAAERARRALNVTVAAVSLVVAAPLMLLIAVVIKLTSPGPALYQQVRVGLDRRNGHGTRRRGAGAPPRNGTDRRRADTRRSGDAGGTPFMIYKFRTMYVHDGPIQETWAQRNDPRVTPVGRFLRRTRLDELPQLFNVLRGDMNVVGPRPEQPTIFAKLREEIPGYPRRQRIHPGITGWAQVRHTYDRSVDDVRTKLKFDLEYIEGRSVLQDVRILLQTPIVMLFRQGSQ
jgi:lipopolysaccharide/colanic/teichoic acid biosynthesis glycosyltransferase